MSVITILVHQLKELGVQNLPRKAKRNSSVHTRGTNHSSVCFLPTAHLPHHHSPSFTLPCSPATRYSQALFTAPLPQKAPLSPPHGAPIPRTAPPHCPERLLPLCWRPTWIRDLMLAKWVSMAPPWGKF